MVLAGAEVVAGGDAVELDGAGGVEDVVADSSVAAGSETGVWALCVVGVGSMVDDTSGWDRSDPNDSPHADANSAIETASATNPIGRVRCLMRPNLGTRPENLRRER